MSNKSRPALPLSLYEVKQRSHHSNITLHFD